jgi:hypothetical protein
VTNRYATNPTYAKFKPCLIFTLDMETNRVELKKANP